MKQPEIRTIEPKTLIGIRTTTTLSANNAAALWGSFMPWRKEIANRIEPDLYSVQVFPDNVSMDSFTPQTPFEKWAAVEVTESGNVPEGMEQYTLAGGMYAVFLHIGPVSTFPETVQYIFGTWLPASKYKLDNRPHFEVMGEKYLGPNNPDSEEEVWVPVKLKA